MGARGWRGGRGDKPTIVPHSGRVDGERSPPLKEAASAAEQAAALPAGGQGPAPFSLLLCHVDGRVWLSIQVSRQNKQLRICAVVVHELRHLRLSHFCG